MPGSLENTEFFIVNQGKIRYNLSMKNVNETVEESAEVVSISRTEYNEYLSLKTQNAELSRQVEWFLEQLRLARQKRFGSSSEQSKYDVWEQPNLFNEAEVLADEAVPKSELTDVKKHVRKKRRETKESLPENLPVETTEHFLPEEERTCPVCSDELQIIGKTVQRRLKLIPASAVILEDIYYTYACRTCEITGTNVPVIRTPQRNNVIKGSFASPEAVAHIITQKFVMGAPLYRQEQAFLRQGITLSRQTLSNWVLKSTEDWLEPIYRELHRRLCTRQVLHGDETTLQVLREPGKSAQSKSYMWLYRTSGDTGQPIILYEYQPDRKARRSAEFLKGFSGYLHADGYSGYHSLPAQITVVGCWAHARRKLDEALKALPAKDREGSLALRGKRYCDTLFNIEEQLAAYPAKKRYEKRQELAKPVLDAFSAWLSAQKTAPKSAIGKAIYYIQEQWPWLINYLLDGRLELSNNRAERSIKPFVIDRKNFLFANTPRGAQGSAVMFSLIETAKENGLDPYRFLSYVFDAAPNIDIGDPKQLERMLPWNAPETCKVPPDLGERSQHEKAK
ncbi:IS66 family transposase [Desulfitobacterium sp. AusDCA]